MITVLNLLAVAGGAAAAWHLVRAALRFLRGGAWGLSADEMANTHARHGDLTSLDERQRERAAAFRQSRRAGLAALFWLALLAVPTLLPWPRAVYAGYAVLWAGPIARRAAHARGGER